ncbi:MAG: GFA family protein [Myxococcota bacterium]|nr:GFA family protein [Myxococcota bacterium]
MTHRASCLCGAVRVEVEGDLPPPDACHCVNCRKHSGHVLAATDVPRENVTVHGEEHVGWYTSSEKVRRGFCKTCGSTLFFDPLDQVKNPWIAISMGAFDTPTRTRLKMHIFVSQKGDYYEIGEDGLPRNER